MSQSSGRTGNRILSVIILVTFAILPIVGVITLAAGIHELGADEPLHGGVTTVGYVAGYRHSSGRGAAYTPVIRFTVAGRGTFSFNASPTFTRPTIGDPASVSYLPSDPSTAHDLTERGSTAYAVTVIALSCVILLLAGFIWTRALRKRRPRPTESAIEGA